MTYILNEMDRALHLKYNYESRTIEFKEVPMVVQEGRRDSVAYVTIAKSNFMSREVSETIHRTSKFHPIYIGHRNVEGSRFLSSMEFIVFDLSPETFKEVMDAVKDYILTNLVVEKKSLASIEKMLLKDSKVIRDHILKKIYKEQFVKNMTRSFYRYFVMFDLEKLMFKGKVEFNAYYLRERDNVLFNPATNQSYPSFENEKIERASKSKLYYTSKKNANPIEICDRIVEVVLSALNQEYQQLSRELKMVEHFYDYSFLIDFPYNFEDIGVLQ